VAIFLRVGFLEICSDGVEIGGGLLRSNAWFEVSNGGGQTPMRTAVGEKLRAIHLLLVDYGDEDVGRDERNGSVE